MIKILHASKRKKNNNVKTLPDHHVMRNFKNIFMVFHEVLKTKWPHVQFRRLVNQT